MKKKVNLFIILLLFFVVYLKDLNAATLDEKHFNSNTECSFYDYEGTIRVINNPSICTTDPSSCIEVKWPKGMVGGNSPGAAFCVIPGGRAEVWYQFDFMYKSPFTYHEGATKLFIVYTGPSVPVGINSNGVYGIGGGYMLYFTQQGPGAGSYGKYNQNVNMGSWFADKKDVWHRIKIYNKMNSGTSTQDGILKVWIDDILVTDHSNVMFDTRGTRGGAYFETVSPYPLFGGGDSMNVPYDQYSYYDHLIISTTDSGEGIVSGTIKIPNPPNRLVIE